MSSSDSGEEREEWDNCSTDDDEGSPERESRRRKSKRIASGPEVTYKESPLLGSEDDTPVPSPEEPAPPIRGRGAWKGTAAKPTEPQVGSTRAAASLPKGQPSASKPSASEQAASKLPASKLSASKPSASEPEAGVQVKKPAVYGRGKIIAVLKESQAFSKSLAGAASGVSANPDGTDEMDTLEPGEERKAPEKSKKGPQEEAEQSF